MKKRFLLHKDKEEKSGIANANLAHLQVASADTRPKLAKELNLAYPPASLIVLCILTMTFFVERLTAQTPTPQFESFKQVNLGNQYYTNSTLIQQNQQTPTQNYSMGGNAQDIINQQNRQAMQQMGYNPPVVPPSDPYLAHQFIINQYNQSQNKSYNQHQELLNILNEVNSENSSNRFEMSYYSSSDFLNKSQSFTDAFNTLNNMLTGKTQLSISKSYLTIENAYGNTYLTEKEYNDLINQSAKFIKQWLIENGLNPAKNEDLHYGLQKFMRDTLTTTVKLPEDNLGKTTTHFPFAYDYQDFQAEKDFQNYFMTKCLATGTGQCNSLPATYLAIAEKLGAKTYLSFAPQHSFIKYPDSKGAIHAYEPTSNWKISDKWYVEHMGINPSAIESGIYLDTLNKKMIVANCMLDLAFGYMKKYGAADGKFVTDCINTAMQYYPRKNNITAYFLKGSLLARQLEYLLYSNGIKDLKDMRKVQGATELYQALLQNEAMIQKLGYQELPEAMYLEMMQYHEFRGKLQQNTNTKQKRNLFSTSMN
jgi:hypothetical protein